MMRKYLIGVSALALALAGWAAATQAQALDLRRAVPEDAYLVIHGRHNPERDYQRRYWREVWETARQTQIVERAVKIITSRMGQDDVGRVEAVVDELREAVAPVDCEAVLETPEVVYTQVLEGPAAVQHLVLWRLTPKAAAGVEQAVKNLFGLAEKYSEGKVSLQSHQHVDVVLTVLALPSGVPFRPAVARVEDVVLLSSSEALARQALERLAGGAGTSKFDDPRLEAALRRLPEPEDSLVFYDVKLQFDRLKGLGAFIRRESGNDPDALRAAAFLEWIMDQVGVVDYQVSVEYTEGNQNRTVVYEKLLPEAKRKLLGEVFYSGQPIERWQTWVPADALAWHLSSGLDLHAAYQGILHAVNEHFPDTRAAVDRFEELQRRYEIDLDEDILQAFTGEFVSISLPGPQPEPLGGQAHVIALGCRKPEEVRQLIHRAVDLLQKIPIMKSQQLRLGLSAGLEGFEELSLDLLKAFRLEPVIGFRDGWMIIGTHPEAVEKVLQTRAGRAADVTTAESFRRFGLEIAGPVRSLHVTDVAASVRNVAQVLRQVGAMGPMLPVMAGPNVDAEQLKPIQELLALLPALAKVVEKLDFYQARLSVTQLGDEPSTHIRRTVVIVRPAPQSCF